MAEHKVIAAAVVVPVGGTERYLYRGAVLPDGVQAADLKRLSGLGLVKKVETPTAAEKAAAEKAAAEKAAAEKAAAEKAAAEKAAAEKAAAPAEKK